MSNDDGIREMHGLAETKTKGAVEIFEDEGGAAIALVANRYLTAKQALHVARALERLAQRVEERLACAPLTR